ncbi:GTPase [Georgenia sp. SYP-B2076]|uniref:GTPase n=1 Tax=Georgenia sp. SYP-B2076 TaxID=2495881 RepID=UPI000F8DBDC3|nr:GTPase [Georgenia sp. SYP-B2076]
MPPQPTDVVDRAGVDRADAGPTDAGRGDVPPSARVGVLTDLRAHVERVRLPLDVPGAPQLRALREELLTQIDTRLLPRLREPAAPAVVVLAGSSGVGKSTLLNSVVGADVSAAGVLRPTTRRAVLAVHPDDAAALRANPLAGQVDVVTDDVVPAGLALLDAPDMDSVHAEHRVTAAALLDAADLWVFVTTAARYGDALPWRLLTRAEEQGVATAVVLNRVPARVLAEVRRDLLSRMAALGLGSAPLFLVPDAGPHEGPLDPAAVAELGGWLSLVAGRHQLAGIVRRTDRGALTGMADQLLALAAGVEAQVDATAELRAAAADAASAGALAVADAIREGRAADGAPTTRWLALTSTGGPLAPVVAGARVRAGWRGRALADRSAAARAAGVEAAAEVEAVLGDALRAAAAAALAAWQPVRLGAQRLGGPAAPTSALGAVPSAGSRAAGAVQAWRDRVLADAAPLAPRVARVMDAESLAALVVAAAAGLRGASVAVGTTLGDDGAALVERARADLLGRAGEAVRGAVQPYLDALDPPAPELAAALRLRAADLREQA